MVHAVQGNCVAGECKEALRPRHRAAGFTLMELSIVLVIIGLLIGGIMVGKELIRASELNSIIKDLDKYNSAILTFKDKYGNLPGDMPNATDFWGIAYKANDGTNHRDTCSQGAYQLTPIGSKLTCNGNGNGMISGPQDSSGADCENNQFYYAFNCDYEPFAVWQHLANAGLIGGIYTPAKGGSNSLAFRPYFVRGVAGANLPAGPIVSTEGFTLMYVCNLTTYYYSTLCGNTFFYGAQTKTQYNNWADFPAYPALTAAEAKGIDVKIDDGKPGTGAVTAPRNGGIFAPNCVTISTTYSTTSGTVCSLAFKSHF